MLLRHARVTDGKGRGIGQERRHVQDVLGILRNLPHLAQRIVGTTAVTPFLQLVNQINELRLPIFG